MRSGLSSYSVLAAFGSSSGFGYWKEIGQSGSAVVDSQRHSGRNQQGAAASFLASGFFPFLDYPVSIKDVDCDAGVIYICCDDNWAGKGLQGRVL